MTTRRKMGIYTNAVTIHIAQVGHEESVQSMKRRQVYCKRRQLINPQQKVKLKYSKEKDLTYS